MHNNTRKENNSANNCTCSFQTEMATKWQELRIADLIIYTQMCHSPEGTIFHYFHFITSKQGYETAMEISS